VPAPRERTHELVVRRIEAELSGGRITLGERLPGEQPAVETAEVGA